MESNIALLIIDMQNDVVKKLPPAPGIIPGIQELLERFRANGNPVFHIRRSYRADGTDVELPRLEQFKEHGFKVVEGTDGARQDRDDDDDDAVAVDGSAEQGKLPEKTCGRWHASEREHEEGHREAERRVAMGRPGQTLDRQVEPSVFAALERQHHTKGPEGHRRVAK